MELSSEGTIGPTDEQAAIRRERFVGWRRVQALGGFVLACCFFLPAVDGCNSPIIPAEEVLSEFQSGIDSVSELCWMLLHYVAAYLFGLLVCILGIWPVRCCRPGPRAIEVAIVALVSFVSFVVFALVIFVLVAFILDPPEGFLPIGFILFVVMVLFSLVYLCRAFKLRRDGLLHVRWYMALCCLVWFMLWLRGKSYYGLWLSIVGSVAILVGATGEAAIRARTTWRPAIRLLLTSRAKLYDDDLPRCENCGYILIGLTEKRCPECGLPFEMINPPRGPESARAPGPSESG